MRAACGFSCAAAPEACVCVSAEEAWDCDAASASDDSFSFSFSFSLTKEGDVLPRVSVVCEREGEGVEEGDGERDEAVRYSREERDEASLEPQPKMLVKVSLFFSCTTDSTDREEDCFFADARASDWGSTTTCVSICTFVPVK